MKREIDLMQQTFFKSRLPQKGLLSRVRPYHPAVFNQEDSPGLKILVLGSTEVDYLKKKVRTIPVTDITDPDTQVWVVGLPDDLTAELKKKPVGFVQDTEVARSALAAGNFQEEKPALSLVPDKNFNY